MNTDDNNEGQRAIDALLQLDATYATHRDAATVVKRLRAIIAAYNALAK
jgi:hypothetical protein